MNTEYVKIKLEDELKERLQLGYKKYNLEKHVQEFTSSPEVNYDSTLTFLLKSGVELNRKHHPDLFTLIDEIKTVLKINPAIHVFTYKQGGDENAYIVTSSNKAIIVFQDNILKLLDDPKEIKFIIGHELGHFIYKHTEGDQYVNYFCNLFDPRIKLQKEEKHFREKEGEYYCDLAHLVKQISELNADRIGLIASNDFEASTLAAAKMEGGFFDTFGQYDSADYLKQAQKLLKADNHFDQSDLESTHPCSPLRVYAANKFFNSIYMHNSDIFKQNTSQSFEYEQNWRYFNAALIQEVLPLTAFNEIHKKKLQIDLTLIPKEIKLEKRKTAGVKEEEVIINQYEFNKDFFLFLASLYVITSVDNKVTKAESKFLTKIVRNKIHLEKILDFNENATDDEVENKYLELVPFAKKLPSRSKTALFKHLIKAAKVDRRFDKEEVEMIIQISEEIQAIDQAKVQLKNMLGIEIEI